MDETITKSIIVKTSPENAYRVWSNFENFPKFMKYIKSVEKTGDSASRWEMQGPAGSTVEWEAEITRMDENKRIGWNTKDRDGGDIKTSGQVTFNALPQNETEVTVKMHYITETGRVGEFIAKHFTDPEEQLETDLRNFKAYVEGMHSRTAAG